MLWYDMYAGMFNLSFTGETWTIGHQSYPRRCRIAASVGPAGILRQIFLSPERGATAFEPFAGNLSLHTSNPSGIQFDARVPEPPAVFPVTARSAAPRTGGYFDNVSVAFVDLRASLARYEQHGDLGSPARTFGSS
jgi:hypothetical protein